MALPADRTARRRGRGHQHPATAVGHGCHLRGGEPERNGPDQAGLAAHAFHRRRDRGDRQAADAQRTEADALFARWEKAHGTTRDDKAFTAWAAQQVPAPPSAKQRTAELRQDQALAKTRTAAGKKAATWLELHGKKDVWQLYLHDQRELIPTARGKTEKAELKAALKLAKTISDQLAAKDKQPAPFVLDPTLRPDPGSSRPPVGCLVRWSTAARRPRS
jgi:hypothetical protein